MTFNKHDYDSKQRFGIRKLSIGVCSVLVSTLFLTINEGQTVHADVQSDDGAHEETVDSGAKKTGQPSQNLNVAEVLKQQKPVQAAQKALAESKVEQKPATADNVQGKSTSTVNAASKENSSEEKGEEKGQSVPEKADSTSASSSSAAKAETTSAKTRQTVTKISYNTLLQQLRTSKALATNKEVLTHVTKDNFLAYFSLNGSATYDQNTGIVTITPDEYNKVGNFSLKSKIDMNTSFTLTGKVNLGSNPNGADGIGFAFHNGNTTDIGNAGGNLGIGGLKNALGFKLDTWSNGYQAPLSDKDACSAYNLVSS